MDTVVVYTDIGNDGDPARLLDRYVIQPDRRATMCRDPGCIGADDTDETSNWPRGLESRCRHLLGTMMTSADSGPAVGGTPGATALTFTGSVHGIPGTFSCNCMGLASSLRVSRALFGRQGACYAQQQYPAGDVEGEAAGVWMFVPDEGAPTVHGRPDAT